MNFTLGLQRILFLNDIVFETLNGILDTNPSNPYPIPNPGDHGVPGSGDPHVLYNHEMLMICATKSTVSVLANINL